MFDLTDAKDTALHRAAMSGHFPMVEHLVKSAGFDVKDKNKVCIQTVLYLYSVKCHTVPYMYHSLILFINSSSQG